MITFDHVPRWLADDDHAAQLLRDGWDLDTVCAIAERAALYRHDGGAGELEAELRATIDYSDHAPANQLRRIP